MTFSTTLVIIPKPHSTQNLL
jgi:hypothetical protein